MEIALEAAPLNVGGRDDPRPGGAELLDPGVELVVQTVDLRLLRLPFGDVGVSDHVAEDPAGSVSDRGSGARPHPHEQLLRLRALRTRRHRESATAKDLIA